MCFSKNDPRPFGVPIEPFLSPLQAILATPESQNAFTKCLENGLLWDQKSINIGSKMCFSKDTFGLLGVHKQRE